MNAFSDGVFAIAITILVLELAVPAGSEEDLLQGILGQWPSYVAYVVSFATIGAVWLKHTVLTDLMAHTDQAFMRLNLGLLMVVSFVPFPTKLVGEHIQSGPEPERVAVMFYGIVLMLMSIIISVMWRYAVRASLVDPEIPDDDVRAATKMLAPSIGFYVVALIVAYFRPEIAVLIMLLAAALFWIPAAVLPRRSSGPAGTS